jgi:hypothetical protein
MRQGMWMRYADQKSFPNGEMPDWEMVTPKRMLQNATIQ